MHTVAWLLSGFSLLAWIAIGAPLWLAARRGIWLRDIAPEGPEPLPPLSVIVPALNEEQTVEAAMRTLLALDYPGLEIIAVDDRSTDGTGAILDRLAVEDPRLRVIHVRELPPGWLGKNHALHTGSLEARGDWLLFTDADVHFAPDSLKRAVRYAEQQRLDHLVVMPDVLLTGFWEKLFVSFFGTMFAYHFRIWKVSDPRSKAHVGVGAFNLVRSAAYRAMGCHAALPLAVADDVKLGQLLKQHGGRAAVVAGGSLVRVRWIVGGLRGAVEGLTKNAFAGVGFRPEAVIGSVILIAATTVWPWPGLFLGPPGARLLCAGTLLCFMLVVTVGGMAGRISPVYGLCYPLASALFCYILLRSMVKTYRQGGIVWRGTLYPLEELRRGT